MIDQPLKFQDCIQVNNTDDWIEDFRVTVNITSRNEPNLAIVKCDGKCNESELEHFDENIRNASLGDKSKVHLCVTWLPIDAKKLNVCSSLTIKRANCHQPNSYRFHSEFREGPTGETQFKVTYKGKVPSSL